MSDEVLESGAVEYLQQGLNDEDAGVFFDPLGVGLFLGSGRGLIDRDRGRRDG